MFSSKKKAQAKPEKKLRLLEVEQVHAANRAEKTLRFLALAVDENDSEALLESLYLAKLLKRNHPGAHTMILTHRANYRFLRRAGVFDRIYFAREARDSVWSRARRIARLRPEMVFSARPSTRETFSMWLSGVRFKLGGFKNSVLVRAFGLYDLTRADHVERLAGKDIRVTPEGVRLSLPAIPGKDLICPRGAFREGPLAPMGDVSDAPYVFLKFPDGDSRWPLSYLPRLQRLCAARGLGMVVQLPETTSAEDRSFLAGEAPTAVQLGGLTAYQTICVVGLAEAVVSTGGPEKVFASMLRRPTVVLDTPAVEASAAAEGVVDGERVIPLRDFQVPASLLDRIKTRARVLHPSGAAEDEVVDLDSISPELVFETLRDVLDEA